MEFDHEKSFEKSLFLKRQPRKSNKKLFYGIAVVALLVVGAYMYLGAPVKQSKTLDVNHAPRAFVCDEDCAAEFLGAINMYRCMHDVPELDWCDPLYVDTEATFGEATEMHHSDSYHLTDA